MTTPIYDFVTHYNASGASRLHMPGHKGHGPLFIEQRDITEIEGADVLSEARGIIGESERNAAALFGTGMTVYSTEGSSLSIRAMLYLVLQRWKRASASLPAASRPVILAARNAHKSFLYACAMLDFDVKWVYPSDAEKNSICACHPSPRQIADALRSMDAAPAAVYLTSPDYLGTAADVRGIVTAVQNVCGADQVPVIVDNAHGAYLHFLGKPCHPMDLGAYLCADSAHKTLPCLTGGAYLHLSSRAAEEVGDLARSAIEMFGSTSPSYLILQSLDLCNRYLADDFPRRLSACELRVEGLKNYLRMLGVKVLESEPLKLVIDAAPRSGRALAELFRAHGIEPEFADINYLVCMFTPENSTLDFNRIAELFRDDPAVWDMPERPWTQLDIHNAGLYSPLQLTPLPAACSIREAMLAPQEVIDVKSAAGRICGQPTVSCPPAIPIAVSGEVIPDSLIPVFLAYGIRKISVVRH